MRIFPLLALASLSLHVLPLSFANAEPLSVPYECSFSPADLVFAQRNGYDWVGLSGCEPVNRPGEPMLPAKLVHLSVPWGMEAETVEIVDEELVTLPGSYTVFPGQMLLPIASSPQQPVFTPPDPTVYSRTEPYPESRVAIDGSGCLGGSSIVSLRISPLEYTPSLRRLALITRLRIRVLLRPASSDHLSPPRRSASGAARARLSVEVLVENPQDVATNEPRGAFQLSAPDSLVEYLIITDPEYQPIFQALADWKTAKGVPGAVLTTPTVYALYSGVDEAEQVRSCIKDYYLRRGTTWVLLGGDISRVPMRYGYSNFQAENEYIPTDYYYSCLDGTWDANRNRTYGEVADGTDLYPEVFVGRAPVDDTLQARVFVEKVLGYEHSPDPSYQRRVLFLGDMLDDRTDTGAAKDTIDVRLVPPLFDPITKLYASRGNENRQAVIDSLNAGFNVVNHDGHGNDDYMAVGQGGLTGDDMFALLNEPRFGILYSMACIAGGFDYEDCIGEQFVKAPAGGGFFIGNSRFGWYVPGTPPGGSGTDLDYQFFHSLLVDGVYHLGHTLADSKLYYAGVAQSENDIRWATYTLNLLGDPETPVWTDVPSPLDVVLPDSIPLAPLNVTVFVSSSHTPVDSALVCLYKAGEVYAVGETNNQGWVTMPVNPGTGGLLYVTVTKRDYLPREDSILVSRSAFPYLYISAVSLNDDDGGNGDRTLDPGETVEATLSLRNSGLAPALGTTGVLHAVSPLVTLLDSTASYGEVSPGSQAEGDIYRLQASSAARGGDLLLFSLALSANGGSYETEVPVTIEVARLYDYVDHDLSDIRLTVTADGALGCVAPGDSGRGLRYPRDAGRSLLYQGSFFLGTDPDHVADRLGSSSDWAVVSSPDSRLKLLTIGDTLQTSWAVFSDAGMPSPRGIEVRQVGEARPGQDFVLLKYRFTNLAAVPLSGIYAALFMDFDIFPDIGYRYNLAGVDIARNLAYVKWSSLNPLAGLALVGASRSANVSVIDNAAYLPSKEFPDSLKFDFMRGLRQSLVGPTQKDWSAIVSCGPYTLAPGFSDSVTFAVFADGTLEEIQAALDSLATGIADDQSTPDPPLPGHPSLLLGHHPDPFQDAVEIPYVVPSFAASSSASVPVRLSVYNLQGQLVRTLVNGPIAAGSHVARWDGRNGGGRQVGNGLYFLRLSVGNEGAVATSRIIRLR